MATKSPATDLVMPTTAALLAPYAKRLGTPVTLEATDDMLMIDPPPLASIPGRNARMVWNIAVALIANAWSQSASVQSSTVPACTMPAQLKRTSMGPTSVARAAMADASVTSRRRVRAPGQRRQQRLVDVGGDDLRALAHERLGAGAADALRRRRHQRLLACQPSRHRCTLDAADVAT